MMRKIQLTTIIIFILQFGFAQNKNYLDSLFNICKKLKSENNLSFPEKAHFLYSETIRLNEKTQKLRTENLLGIYYTINQRFDSGYIYFSKALYSAEISNDKTAQANAKMNIGIVLRYQKLYLKAEQYFNDALLVSKKINDKEIQLNGYYNLSGLYLDWGKYLEALEANKKSLSLAKETNNLVQIVKSLEAIGSNYSELHQLDSAKHYLLLAYDKSKFIEYSDEISYLCNNIGGLYLQLKDFKTAEKFLLIAKEHALKFNLKNSLIGIYGNLKVLYYQTNQLQNSIKFDNSLDSLQTIIFNEDILNTTTEMESKYQNEKKQLQINNLEKDHKLQNLQLTAEKKENELKNKLLYLGAFGLLVVAIFGLFAYINFVKAKKANTIINHQNQVLELQKKEVENQKHIIEEKQSEIISSINYAQRIQNAVLTGEEVWSKISKEYFIVYQPRDIVSGDFYWAHVLPNGRAVFALADCTGHGVPGGFMSMLGNSFLNEIVVENKLFKADEILNRLREKVISALFQKGQAQQKDGMDMALCVWNKMDNTIEFAGANNSLYLIRDNELTEFKGDKMPIGSYLEENNKFTAQKITLQTNDIIYLNTDGFADQFGGPNGKKFKSKQLAELLLSVSTKNLSEQKIEITNAFLAWKNLHEQTDDVSMIGIKVV